MRTGLEIVIMDIEEKVLQSVDKDIKEHFDEIITVGGSGSFPLSLPLYIHLCRYLKKVSEQLTVICKARQ